MKYDKNMSQDGFRKLHVPEKCGNCKYWQAPLNSKEGSEPKFGLCCYSAPPVYIASEEEVDSEKTKSLNKRAFWSKTHKDQKGCGSFEMEVRYKRYINSRLVNEELIEDSLIKILDNNGGEGLSQEDYDYLLEDLCDYFKGKIPDYVAINKD